MTLLLYKIFAALLIFLVSIVSVIYPLKKKNAFKHAESVSLGEALASGIFLGVAFFHMLPDAIRLFVSDYPTVAYPVPEVICVSGFLLLLFLERISTVRTDNYSVQSIPYILAIMLTIHALIEGAALGIGANFSEAFMIFIAILAHKMSESFALCIVLLRHKLPVSQILIVVILFSFMTPLGIFLGSLLNHLMISKSSILIATIFNAFAAGTFLYISTLHHIHAHQHAEERKGLEEFVFLVSGVIVMAAIAWWS